MSNPEQHTPQTPAASMSWYEKWNKGLLSISFLSGKTLWVSTSLSVFLILLSFGLLAVKGLHFGVDFTGGVVIEVGYPSPANVEAIRAALAREIPPPEDKPDAKPIVLKSPTVQYVGSSTEVLIRLGPMPEISQEMLSNAILARLQETEPAVSLRRIEFVGAQVGKELVESGGLAILYTFIGVLIYVAFRFEYRFALGAVLALLHDPILVLGYFSLTGMEFDLSVLAAILAVIGYSLNDTIVVFDRIRDNFLKFRKKTPLEVMNLSINETLARTTMTSWATLLTVLALYFLGGDAIHGFAAALAVGIVVGTYSSIFVASALTLKLGVSKTDLLPSHTKEGGDIDGRP